LPRDNIYEIINTKTINKCFFITMILRCEIVVKDNRIDVESHKISPSILTKKEYNDTIKKEKYREILGEKKDFEVDNNKINIYLEYQRINKNKKNIEYVDFIYQNIASIKSTYLLEWKKNKPKYDPKKYPDIKSEEYDDKYNYFVKLLPKMKKIKNFYMNGSILFENNYLYKFFMKEQNIIGKIIDIEKPIFFDRKLSSSLFSSIGAFICHTTGKQKNALDNYYKIDDSYPHGVIIKYEGNISYLPLNSDVGFTFSIKQIKIKKVEKIYITNDVYYYLVEAK
jgi:hypothetical protein